MREMTIARTAEIKGPGSFAFFSLMLCLAMLTACATVGPDFKKPEPMIEDEWIEKEPSQIKTESGDYSSWWEVFQDPVLDRLIDMAYEQNLTLRMAGLKILEARARLGIATGFQYPQAQLVNGGYSLLKISENEPPVSNLPDDVRNQVDTRPDNYRMGFDAAWELDFWGKFRRTFEAANADLAATIASYDSLLVILAGEVASAYIDIRTLEQRLVYARSNIELQKKSLSIATARFEEGAISELDVHQAKSLLNYTLSTIPVFEISIRQAKNALSVLLGIPPNQLLDVLSGTSVIPTPPVEVAVGIPADLIRRRPDIQLAEFQAASQGALIGVARADLFPHIGLAGSIGFGASDGESLFTSASTFGFLSPVSFSWDILNYGRIKNRVRVQDARFEQLLAGYQNKVIEAAREVEDGLVGFIRSQEQAKYLFDAVGASQRASDVALIQYEEGLVDYYSVVITQQSLVSQQDSLATSQGDIDRYLIAVYKAMGGGWQIRLGKELIPEQTLKVMRDRTDWGKILEPTLPDEQQDLPTGKEVKLFNRLKW